VEVPLGLLADAANVSQEGKLNVLGVFDEISSAAFPAVHSALVLVLRFECNSTEFNQTKPISIIFRDADGREINRIDGELVVSGKGPAGGSQVIIPVTGLILPGEGAYDFVIQVSGETKKHIPLRANLQSGA